jgi:hypothetical protein
MAVFQDVVDTAKRQAEQSVVVLARLVALGYILKQMVDACALRA